MLTYKLHFIRHGITQGNLDGRYIGRTDLPLCKEGADALRELLDVYQYPRVGMVYTSPLLRCTQTAQILYPNNQITAVEELTEMDMGEFDGQLLDDLNQDPRFTAWLENTLHNPPPGGEESVAFVARIIRGLDIIFQDMMRSHIHDAAVITPGGVIMSLLASLGMPRQPIQAWKTESGFGYTVIMSPEMWTRDRMFEVFEHIPLTEEEQNAQWMLERFGSLHGDNLDWEDDLDDNCQL